MLHAAARIIPAIRKYSMGYDDGMTDESKPGFWDGRSLNEEPMVRLPLHIPVLVTTAYQEQSMRPTTVVLAYRRAILIAVYTHLLRKCPKTGFRMRLLTPPVLDAGSQTWWRWINITLFLATWSLELLLEADDDSDSISRWKME